MTSYCVCEYIDIDFNMPTIKLVKMELSILSCVFFFFLIAKKLRRGGVGGIELSILLPIRIGHTPYS